MLNVLICLNLVVVNVFSNGNESLNEELENNYYFIHKIFSSKSSKDVEKIIEEKKQMDIQIAEKSFSLNEYIEPVKTLDFIKKFYNPKKEIVTNNIMSENLYFESPINQVNCRDHVRILSLPYTCVGGEEQLLIPNFVQMYVIKHGFQKYFLKIDEEKFMSQISSQNFIVSTGLFLNPIKYKIVKGRYIGVYEYEENRGLLDTAVRMDTLSKFDKYNYMLSIAQAVTEYYLLRDPKNPAAVHNLHPQNILLTKSSSYGIIFIHSSNKIRTFRTFLETPEDSYKSTSMNHKSRFAYILGKLFYFILFRKIIDSSEDIFAFLLHYEAIYENSDEAYDIEIIELLKQLLSFNVSDRPSFTFIVDKLKDVINGVNFIKKRAEQSLVDFYLRIKDEGDNEVSTNVTHLNNKKHLGANAEMISTIIPKKPKNNIVVKDYVNNELFYNFFQKKVDDIENEKTTNGLLPILKLSSLVPNRDENQRVNYYSFEPMVDDELHYRLLEELKKIDVKDMEFKFLTKIKLGKSPFITTILKKVFLEYVEQQLAMEGYYRLPKEMYLDKPLSINAFFEPYLIFTLVSMLTISAGVFFSMYVRKYSMNHFDTSKFQLPVLLE